MKHIKGILCAAAIGLMLIVQLLQAASVFADGEGTPLSTSTPEVTETPQPTETALETTLPSSTPVNTVTPEETTSPTDVPAVTLTPDPNEPTVEPVVATPIATEFATPGGEIPTVASVATTPTPTIVPTEEEDETKVAPTDASTQVAEPVVLEDESTMVESSLGEVLSEIKAETEVVILNMNGQPEPLATVEAAEAVSSGDPVWCPEGQAPTPGANGCTRSYETLGELVADAGAGINANGTIWIASGSVGDTNPVIIDGSQYSNWANYSLNLQGGWSGINGDTTLSIYYSEFTVPIAITNWNNGIFIDGIATSSINLSNIISNTGDRVFISRTTSNVNLENIQIENAAGTGLVVWTEGSIQGANLISNNNHQLANYGTSDLGGGADFDSGQDILLTGTNQFNDNEAAGLTTFSSNGNITLNNITANNNGNGGIGAWANNGDVILNNVTANSNNEYGLAVSANTGNINMNNITANYNKWAGIDAETTSGNIVIKNISANNNGSYGLGTSSYGTTLIQNASVSGNLIGIAVHCSGNVMMSNVEISNNAVGLHTEGVNSIIFADTNFVNNGIEREDFNYPCDAPAPTPIPIIVQAEGNFTFDCSKQAAYPVQLPNGDLVNIFCPVSGTASIYRLDNTNLPENLPEGYIYASAFTLDILQKGVPISVITEGGYVKSSFVAQPLQPGNTYTVLYWDSWIYENGELVENPAEGSWVPLKDFLLDGNGNTISFDLFPGTDDPRRVISGVNLVNRNGSESIEVSTNFPGIFVLAQR